MNKISLIKEMAERTRFRKTDLAIMVDSLTEIIEKTLKNGEDITLMGFGTFSTVKRKARRGYNPHTGEELRQEEMVLPRFRAGKNFKEKLNGEGKNSSLN